MNRYDLYIVNPITSDAPKKKEAFDYDLFLTRGWILLDMTLEDAGRLLKEVRELKGNAYLIPTEYRTPAFSITGARQIALSKYDELKRSGMNLGDLDGGFDDLLWWSFDADDLDAIAKDIIPGRIRISVDKLDGHFRTSEEFQEWLKLSSL